MRRIIRSVEKGAIRMIKVGKEVIVKMEKALEKALQNPFWKKQYENAPSEECKDYLRYTFYSSACFDPDAEDAEDFDKLQAEVESKLKAADWEYLKQIVPGSPFVGYCDQKIKELRGK